MRTATLIPTLLATLPLVAHAAALESAEDIRRCVIANTPDESHVQAIELIAEDRVGNERVLRAHVYGRRDQDGQRRVLVRFSEPEELAGSAFVFLERPGGNELVVRSPDMEGTKRITGPELLGSVLGTDFTYEDFERLRVLNQPGKLERQADGVVDGRPAWVLVTRPADPEHSAYERVLHYIDKQTCLMPRVEFYETGNRLRKVLTTSPERFREIGSVWVYNEIVLSDVRDGTRTRLIIESFDIDADIPASVFSLDLPDGE
jgi:hypothetical protein